MLNQQITADPLEILIKEEDSNSQQDELRKQISNWQRRKSLLRLAAREVRVTPSIALVPTHFIKSSTQDPEILFENFCLATG